MRPGALAAAALLTLVACSSGEPSPPPTTSAPTASPSPTPTPTPEPVWPLTGLPATAAEVAARPALVVKVDNTAAARPQVGLSAADLVVEELVEGGLTRLAAMFHSALPTVVGPVRSVRTSDIGIVSPTGGAIVASGGAGRVLRQLDDAGLTLLTGEGAGLSRAGDREAPYNVMLDPNAAVAAATAAELSLPAQPYLPWGEAVPAGTAATAADVTFSPARTTHWTWAEGGWRQTDGLMAPAEEFVATSVLVLRVTTRDAGYEDPGGNPVPETVLEGSGEAILLVDGRQVAGRWSKADAASPFVLTTPTGEALGVPPGHTWIELVPEAGTVTIR